MAYPPQHALAHRTFFLCAACALFMPAAHTYRRPTWPRLLLRRTARSPRLASTTCWRVSATACWKEPPNHTRNPAGPAREGAWCGPTLDHPTVSIGTTPRAGEACPHTCLEDISETEERVYDSSVRGDLTLGVCLQNSLIMYILLDTRWASVDRSTYYFIKTAAVYYVYKEAPIYSPPHAGAFGYAKQ